MDRDARGTGSLELHRASGIRLRPVHLPPGEPFPEAIFLGFYRNSSAKSRQIVLLWPIVKIEHVQFASRYFKTPDVLLEFMRTKVVQKVRLPQEITDPLKFLTFPHTYGRRLFSEWLSPGALTMEFLPEFTGLPPLPQDFELARAVAAVGLTPQLSGVPPRDVSEIVEAPKLLASIIRALGTPPTSPPFSMSGAPASPATRPVLFARDADALALSMLIGDGAGSLMVGGKRGCALLGSSDAKRARAPPCSIAVIEDSAATVADAELEQRLQRGDESRDHGEQSVVDAELCVDTPDEVVGKGRAACTEQQDAPTAAMRSAARLLYDQFFALRSRLSCEDVLQNLKMFVAKHCQRVHGE